MSNRAEPTALVVLEAEQLSAFIKRAVQDALEQGAGAPLLVDR
jgi:hypothetical protein